jgi:hypothetical protein
MPTYAICDRCDERPKIPDDWTGANGLRIRRASSTVRLAQRSVRRRQTVMTAVISDEAYDRLEPAAQAAYMRIRSADGLRSEWRLRSDGALNPLRPRDKSRRFGNGR